MQERLFFFFNYEGTRMKQGVSRIARCRCDNERIGDFSPAAAAAAGVAPIRRSWTRSPATPRTTWSGGCQAFANNQIPQSRIDTAVAGLMALFPEPNFKNGGQLSRAEQLLPHRRS